MTVIAISLHQVLLFLKPLWPSQPQGIPAEGMATPELDDGSDSHTVSKVFYFLEDTPGPSRRVSIEPLPVGIKVYTDTEVNTYNYIDTHKADDGSLLSNRDDNHTPQEASKSFTFIYANINSWSANAQNTLLDSSVHAEILFMVETHQLSGIQIKADLRQNGRRAFLNHAVPSEKSTIGSHGGEAIAPLNHLNIRPISQELRSEVCRVTAEPLRCALAILQLKGLPILVGDVYMWDTEELSDRNINILRQLYIIKDTLKLF